MNEMCLLNPWKLVAESQYYADHGLATTAVKY